MTLAQVIKKIKLKITQAVVVTKQ